MIEISYKEQKVDWDMTKPAELKEVNGKHCLVFLNKDNQTPKVISFDSKTERDAMYQQLRQQLKDAGVLQEIKIQLKRK